MKSITSSNAATSRGAATLLASGMKISAEPKPENPRAVPETKAIAQIASATSRLTSAGMSSERLISTTSGAARQMKAAKLPGSCPHMPDHARKLPPVFLVTSATILAPTASIS